MSSSRAAGANFSGAMFRNSTIQRMYAFESKWDRAQFEQTNIFGNNFARASFHDAVFRDQARTVSQEQSATPPGQKQRPSAESPEQRGSNQVGSEPSDERVPDGSSRKPWTQRLGSWAKQIGSAVKDTASQIYRGLRDWWTQPLRIAPEIDRSQTSWAQQEPPPAFYPQYEAPPGRAPVTPEQQAHRQAPQPAAAESSERGQQQARSKPEDTSVPSRPAESHAQGVTPPALIARNNFQYADFTGARFDSIRVQDNDFRNANLSRVHFPDRFFEANRSHQDQDRDEIQARQQTANTQSATQRNVPSVAQPETAARKPPAAPDQTKTQAQQPSQSNQGDNAALPQKRRGQLERLDHETWIYRNETSSPLDLAHTVTRVHEAGGTALFYKAGEAQNAGDTAVYRFPIDVKKAEQNRHAFFENMAYAAARLSPGEAVRPAEMAGARFHQYTSQLRLSQKAEDSLSILPEDAASVLARNTEMRDAFVRGYSASLRDASRPSQERDTYLATFNTKLSECLGQQPGNAVSEQSQQPSRAPASELARQSGQNGNGTDRQTATEHGHASAERAEAIVQQAERLHDDLNATKHATDRKELLNESNDVKAEEVALRQDNGLDNSGRPPAEGPSLATEQARFDALLSVGVFDYDRPVDWRKAMEQRLSDRFTALSRSDAADFADHRALWFEAAKQVQQEASGRPSAAASTQTQAQTRNENEESRQQTNDSRRSLALAR